MKKVEVDKEKLALLLEEGYTNKQLADYFKCSIPTIIRNKNKTRKPVNIDLKDFLFFMKEGCTNEELADVFSCSVKTISRFKDKHNLANYREPIIKGKRKCKTCNTVKALLDFEVCNRNSSGISSRCKLCANENGRKHYANNKDYYREKRNYRRASKLQATPCWYSELDRFVLQEAYDLCILREKETGLKHHVDHIIPLKGKEVCGLHYYKNWQVIPAKENLSKGSKLLEKYKNG